MGEDPRCLCRATGDETGDDRPKQSETKCGPALRRPGRIIVIERHAASPFLLRVRLKRMNLKFHLPAAGTVLPSPLSRSTHGGSPLRPGREFIRLFLLGLAPQLFPGPEKRPCPHRQPSVPSGSQLPAAMAGPQILPSPASFRSTPPVPSP